MSELEKGVFSYGFYQWTFLTAICVSVYVLFYYYLLIAVLFLVPKLLYTLWERFYAKPIDVADRAVFITGCDTGLGNRYARVLDDRGFTVFAGCLNPDSPGAESLRTECSSRLHVVQVDVTQQQSVNEAFQFVNEHLPRNGLWGVVNNAGMDMLGLVELSPVCLYEKGFELNLFGYIRVIQTFLPLIRKSQGRIVNISSVRGQICEPNQSNYGTTKHGIETMSDSLRLEMIKFGVKVSIIEPGVFGNATSIASEAVIKRNQAEIDLMWNSAREEVKQSYTKEYLSSFIPKPTGGWPPKADSTVVAKAVEHALCSRFPKHRYLVPGTGTMIPFIDEYAVLTLVYNKLPTWIIDKYTVLWKGSATFKPKM